MTASFAGEQKSIEIIRSGGEALTDVRPLIRFNVSVMLEKNGRKETGVYAVSYTTSPSPRDATLSRMPSSA